MNISSPPPPPPRFSGMCKMTAAIAGFLPARRLPLLALLALAATLLWLPAAEPARAQAQYTYLSATLTVDEQTGQYYGCDDRGDAQDNCSDASVLTDTDFTFDGDTYTIFAVYWDNVSNALALGFKDLFSAEVEPALGSFTLHVDGAQFAVADSTAGTQGIIHWPFDPGHGLDRRPESPAAADLDACAAPGQRTEARLVRHPHGGCVPRSVPWL